MKGFLDYLDGKTILHKLHPLVKLLVAFLICAAAFCSENYFFLIGIVVLNFLLALLGNGKNVGLLKRTVGLFVGLLKMSVFLFVLQVLVIRGGNVVLPLGKSFGITDEGIKSALIIILRLTAATLPLSILISVTNLNDLSNTLVKNLHIPYKYAFAFTSAIRFIPVFSSEMAGIIESQKARGVDFEVKNPFKKIGMIVPLCFPLLISSVRKIESTAVAAELRGFYFRSGKNCSKSYSLSVADVLFVMAGACVLACGILI